MFDYRRVCDVYNIYIIYTYYIYIIYIFLYYIYIYYISGQIIIIHKPEIRPFGNDSPY